MSKNELAKTVGEEVGFDPTIILTIFSFLLPLIQEWCKPKNKDDAENKIDDEFKRLRLIELGKKKGDKCPARMRKAFKQAAKETEDEAEADRLRDKNEQDKVWKSMVDNGFDYSSTVAGFIKK